MAYLLRVPYSSSITVFDIQLNHEWAASTYSALIFEKSVAIFCRFCASGKVQDAQLKSAASVG